MSGEELFSRRDLPHWFKPGAIHFVTYRLADTIPIALLNELRANRTSQLRQLPVMAGRRDMRRELIQKKFFAEYDAYLDRVGTVDWLQQPALGVLIRNNLLHHQASKYDLYAYCVMPTHVHVLLRPTLIDEGERQGDSGRGIFGSIVGQSRNCDALSIALESDEIADSRSPLASVMHSLKSYTAHEANKILCRSGQFWQHESYDHWVRDIAELERIIEYIEWNPVKAGLVSEPALWRFSSAYDRLIGKILPGQDQTGSVDS